MDARPWPSFVDSVGPTPTRLPLDAPRQADAALMEHLAQGRTEALAELYDLHGGTAYSVAFRITRDFGLAEDAVQEAFLAAWQNASHYAPGRGSLKSWLLTIVHRRAVDTVRRRRRPTESLTEETRAPELERQDVWMEVTHELDKAAVVQALNDLPDAQRVAIELSYFGGLTHVELSVATGAPLGTVKSRVRAGLESLRRSLIPCGRQGPSSHCVRRDCDHCASRGSSNRGRHRRRRLRSLADS